MVLAVQREAPAGPVEHFIDGAQEAAELDACSAMCLRLYGDSDTMAGIINRADPAARNGYDYRSRRRRCLELADYADTQILPYLDRRRQGGMIRYGLNGITYELTGLAAVLAGWGIEDEIDGGMMIDFRTRPRCTWKGETFKRTDRRVRSPKFIRRYVKKEGPEAADHLKVLSDRNVWRAWLYGVDSDPTIQTDYRAQLSKPSRDLQDSNVLRHLKATGRRRILRDDRKVIRRALNTAVSLLGHEIVAAFVRGEEVRLVGTDTMLTLRRRGSLTQRGHGAISVGLADRNGVALADLCTYIEDTPTLDQLTGFALWMQSGEEAAILERANIISTTGAGKRHPMLTKHVEQKRADAVAELAAILGDERTQEILSGQAEARRARRGGLGHDARRARNEAYWEETKGEWLEALVVLVIGYRNLPIFKAAGAL